MNQICFNSTTFYIVIMIGLAIMTYTISSIYIDLKIKNVKQRHRYHGRQIDLERMIHPMTPPMRRENVIPINIPSRGEYGSFHMMGYLHNTADPKQTMPLMGRRIHSNQYEYYTFHHYNPIIKIPIKINKEINDGEKVSISTYPGVNFTASLYDTDIPRYLPY